jgi:tol-pal system protein YbgF
MRRLWLTLGCGLALGCVRTTEERQLDEMREALTHVDENPSFGEKLTTKELAEIARDGRPPVAGIGTARPVMRFDDGTEEESGGQDEAAGFEAADDPSQRPLLRVHGVPHASEVVEQTMPDEGAVQNTAQAPQPSALNPDARKAYDAALALVNNKQYTQALDAFAGFLLRYPDHPYAANAMYWRGECYFAQGDYVRAVEQFEGVVARFPLGAKTPDALLKLGICQQKLQNPQKAQSYFEKLTREWPRSEAARRIPNQKETP